MISMGLMNLAGEYTFQHGNGIVYGMIRGYMTSFSEGIGHKDLSISLLFPAPENAAGVLAILDSRTHQKFFRIKSFLVQQNGIQLVFVSNPGTLKRIRAFIIWFYPILREFGALDAGICPYCQKSLADVEKVVKQIDNKVVAFHPKCATKITDDIARHNEAQASLSPHLVRGFFGALLVGLIGVIPWAILSGTNFFVVWLGLTIGFLNLKGYTLLGGRIKKSTVPVLIATMILSVVAATFLGDCIWLAAEIGRQGMTDISLIEVPGRILQYLRDDPEFRSSFNIYLILGLFFAGLGSISPLSKTFKMAVASKLKIDDP